MAEQLDVHVWYKGITMVTSICYTSGTSCFNNWNSLIWFENSKFVCFMRQRKFRDEKFLCVLNTFLRFTLRSSPLLTLTGKVPSVPSHLIRIIYPAISKSITHRKVAIYAAKSTAGAKSGETRKVNFAFCRWKKTATTFHYDQTRWEKQNCMKTFVKTESQPLWRTWLMIQFIYGSMN